MDSSSYAIADILREIHQSLDRLSTSLLPSNDLQLPPPPSHQVPSSSLPQAAPILSPSQSITPQLNPLPQRPIIPPALRFPVTDRPSYTDVIRAAILSQPALPRSTKPRPTVQQTKSLKNAPVKIPVKNPVRTKLAQMRSLTERGIPICYKCGEQGHYTDSCRNSLICFKCRTTGHRSSNCLTTPRLLKPTPSNLKPPPTASLTNDTSLPTIKQPDSPIKMFPRPIPTPERRHEANILPPMRYYATPGTTQLRNSLSQGVVLSDTRRLGAQFIQAHLQRLFPINRWTWTASELPNNQFLIASPDQDWRRAVLREHRILLGDISFPAEPYVFSKFNNGSPLKTYWVQIFDYPHDLWRNPELTQLARELGGILVDSDPLTIVRSNLVLTRIKIAVPDKEVILACRNLVFTEDNGATSTYLIQTMVEDDDSDQPWGHSRTQLFSLNRKRQRSPSPPL